MFHTFTGSSRRPRQVNLSGRTPNPFAMTGSGAGSQAALDRAHQERMVRQRERERLNAAKTLQRVWRGHSCRQGMKQELRKAWDSTESSPNTRSGQIQPYPSEAEALYQFQRLLKFADVRDDRDIERIKRIGRRQIQTVHGGQDMMKNGAWPMVYLRFQTLLLSLLEHRSTRSDTGWADAELLDILEFTTAQVPRETARNAVQYYKVMATLCGNMSTQRMEAVGENRVLNMITLPLHTLTADTLLAYEAFACVFITTPGLVRDLSGERDALGLPQWLDKLAERINYKLFANAVASVVKAPNYDGFSVLSDSVTRLRLLGCFIFFHRHAHAFRNPQAYSSHKDFVDVVSTLLPSVAHEIRLEADLDEDESEGADRVSLSGFLENQILSLVNQESIGSLLGSAGSRPSYAASDDESASEAEAKQLASYALTLLRVFPNRGDEIRMWLYLGSSSFPAGGESNQTTAIRYFWQAASVSGVLRLITRDPRTAINLLRPKHPSPGSNGWQPARSDTSTPTSALTKELASVDDDWRIILIFMELYTFVLKLMDDEEFFSGANSRLTSTSVSSWTRDNALPLEDVKNLTVFLKNLGFTLYFNASDISGESERDSNMSTISNYFRVSSDSSKQFVQPINPEPRAAEPCVAGLAGITIEYMKGLVTGLLRMIYERDSRRNFLPADHWLMTSRFDMEGFIPSVVQEEESRHKIEEEDADDEEEPEQDDLRDGPHLIGTWRTQQARAAERLRRQQRKASRRRYLQAVAPRLEILQNMPFFIPFSTRVQIFRQFVTNDKIKRRRGHPDPESWRVAMMSERDGHEQMAKHHARIRRKHEFEDAYEQFYSLKDRLKEPIQITFVDQFGANEAGIDGGGVTKEFLTSVSGQAFDPNESSLFVENDQHLLYPNPAAIEEIEELYKSHTPEEVQSLKSHHDYMKRDASSAMRAMLRRYEFLGRVVGKCLYESILVDINFAPFFLLKWALTGGTGSAPQESGYRANLNDLRDLDEALYQGLIQLKNYAGDVEDFSLNFTVSDTVNDLLTGSTKTITRDLKPGGSSIPVTNENRLVYISYMVRHRLQVRPYRQTNAFLRGLSSMIEPTWLRMFNQSELQTLIGGTSTSIDIADLRRNTHYGGVYQIGDDGLEHPTVQMFWSVMQNLDDEGRKAVLKFVTSTPRAPLLGFASLNPAFSIRDAGDDQTRLPSTSTCVNLLKLPMYRDENVLREKLLYAIFSGAGFDLS